MSKTPRVRTLQAVRPGELIFRVHSPKKRGSIGRVMASVFAEKLGTLVRALKEADRAMHGVVMHDYSITKLKSSSPTAILAEEPLPKYENQLDIGSSAIEAFAKCAAAISVGNIDRAREFGKC